MGTLPRATAALWLVWLCTLGASASALPPVARWASAVPVRPAALRPGTYAVSCGVIARGEDRAEAMRACEAEVRASRWLDRRQCRCRSRADVVVIAATDAPAFWLAGWTFKGATPLEALARCLTDVADGADPLTDCRERLQAVYGPFERRPTRYGFDDDTRYRWLAALDAWVDDVGEGPCFTADTLVATPDGERPIAALRVGDAVLSWPTSAAAGAVAGEDGVGRVTRVKRRVVAAVLALSFSDGRTLRATGNHPLFSAARGRFVAAEALRPGESVVARARGGAPEVVTLERVTVEPGPVEVWDVSVAPDHTLFAAGVWAHNY